ncbi:unnamed protein product [Calypogeia fissa]
MAMLSSPSTVEGYDGPSLSQWVADPAWRTMGTEIVNSIATQCSSQGGISIYQAKWQTDCNLMVYKDFTPHWSSNTKQFGYHVCYLAMQRDGNLVIYGERADERVVIWTSNSTQAYEDDFYASITLYGNLGVFTSTHKPIWYAKDPYISWP